MMRYRRNRASTLEPAGGAPMGGQPQQQQPVYGGQQYVQPQVAGTNLSANPNSGWATYQPGAKPVANMLPQQQMQPQQGVRKVH